MCLKLCVDYLQDMENLILEMFMNKLLHDHELGKYKDLCEKLEATLETNRKKTAQFQKEVRLAHYIAYFKFKALSIE